MKNFILLFIITLSATLVSFKGIKSRTYKVDSKTSTIVWTGKKVTGEHKGNVSVSSGNLNVTDNKLTDGTFVINLASITVTDIADPEKNAKLVGHLKNEDFFGVDKYPTSQLVITKAFAKQGDNYEITGNLTIKGITKPVTFPATVKISDKNITAKAQIIVNRTLFDIKYKSSNYFENLGDKAIYDDFTLDIDLTASSADKI